jgi:hypothetical protein
MDSKTLFHNPESLTDDDLAAIRSKLWYQRRSAQAGALGGGFFMYVMQMAVLKRVSPSIGQICFASFAGYLIAANGVNSSVSMIQSKLDRDITHAFDQRQLRGALAVSGLLTHHTSYANSEDNNDFSKPY